MVSIDRSNGPTLILVLIALLAIASSAATITDVSSVGSGSDRVNVDFGGGGRDTGDNGNQEQPALNDTDGGDLNESTSISLTACVDVLTTPVGIGGLLLVIVGILAGLRHRFNTAVMVFAGFAIVPMVFAVWALLTNCTTGSSSGGGIGTTVFEEGGGGVSSAPVDPGILGLAFGAVVLAGLVVMITMTMRSSEETFEPVETEEEPDADEAAFARAAGRAADRIEETNVTVDNAVYEAWVDMTDLLNMPSPETSAPMDFADVAIETGLDPADVYRLTELFNEVRYGHEDPDAREEQAIETLRHIESAYEADEDDTGGDR